MVRQRDELTLAIKDLGDQINGVAQTLAAMAEGKDAAE